MPADTDARLLRDWVFRAAWRAPAKPWIVSAGDGRTVGFGALREMTLRIAAFLHARGIDRNDRVALLANNSIEHLLCYFGVMAYGATICTVHVEMNRNQLDNIFERLKPRLIVYQAGLGLDDLLAAAPVPRLPLGRWGAAENGKLFAELARCAPEEPTIVAEPDDDAII